MKTEFTIHHSETKTFFLQISKLINITLGFGSKLGQNSESWFKFNAYGSGSGTILPFGSGTHNPAGWYEYTLYSIQYTGRWRGAVKFWPATADYLWLENLCTFLCGKKTFPTSNSKILELKVLLATVLQCRRRCVFFISFYLILTVQTCRAGVVFCGADLEGVTLLFVKITNLARLLRSVVLFP